MKSIVLWLVLIVSAAQAAQNIGGEDQGLEVSAYDLHLTVRQLMTDS